MLALTDKKEGLVVKVAVVPRASRNQVAGLKGDALKIKLTAPPVEGAANKACLQLLAKALGLPKSSLTIASGESSRTKRILIRLNPEDAKNTRRLRDKLLELAGK
ncbi:MAG: DUF167 domain-containing protein [Desulfosarcinaceae bacterium]